MTSPIECQHTPCRVNFKPRGNQRYHSPECARQGRRVKDRLLKRKQRREEYTAKIEQETASFQNQSGERLGEVCGPVRRSTNRQKFFYRCDTCDKPIKRPPKELHAYCSLKCRRIARNKRRRLMRAASGAKMRRSRRGAERTASPAERGQNQWSPHCTGFP